MLADMGYEQQIHSHIYCCILIDGVYAPIQVIECWLSLLGYTRQDLSVQRYHHFFVVDYS